MRADDGQLRHTLHAEVATIGPVYAVQPLECLQQVLHGQIGMNGQEDWAACSSMADLQNAPSAYKLTRQDPHSLFPDPIMSTQRGVRDSLAGRGPLGHRSDPGPPGSQSHLEAAQQGMHVTSSSNYADFKSQGALKTLLSHPTT